MTSKPKPTCKFIICSHACAYHCTQLWYTIQHKWVLIIFSHNLQTIIIALMLSIGGKGKFSYTPLFHHHKALTLSLPSIGHSLSNSYFFNPQFSSLMHFSKFIQHSRVITWRELYLPQLSSLNNAKVSEEGKVAKIRAMAFNIQCPGDLLDRLKYWKLLIASKWCFWRDTVNHTTVTST